MELAQLCTAPHVEFLFSSLAGHLVGPLAPRHPHLVCALRPAAYPPGMAAKEVLPLPRRRGFVKMFLRHWGD